MRILIAGATGLVGSELVKLCHEEGFSVNYLTTSKDKIVSEENLKGFYWDPEKEEIDSRCLEGVTSIVNLAGASIAKRWTPSYRKVILSSRTKSAITLVKALKESGKHKIDTYISASAIGVYPSSLSKFYTEEEQEVANSFLGEVVQHWEQAADLFDQLGLRVVKIRIGLVLSTEGGALPEMARPIRNYVGAAFGSGEQWQSWIHVKDLARLFLFAVVNRIQGIYNGVAPNPVTNAKLTKEIARVLRKPLILPNIPKFAMKLVLGEMSSVLFESQRVSSKKVEDAGFEYYYPNIGIALQHLLGSPSEKVSEKGRYMEEYIS